MTRDSKPPQRKNTDVVAEHVPLTGARVLDVGCGDGALVRMMTRRGAHVVGLECNPKQLSKARAKAAVGDETYVEGVGEDLPFEESTMDAVVYFNSLHHVPVAALAKALAEAARVIRPGGMVYVAEPMAEGNNFRLVLPIHDETEVRAAAYAAIKDAGAAGLSEEMEFVYLHRLIHPNFEAFRERMLGMNPNRRELFAANEETLRANFQELGEETEDGQAFDQPMRVNLLRKI